jgi:hypothetical protein
MEPHPHDLCLSPFERSASVAAAMCLVNIIQFVVGPHPHDLCLSPFGRSALVVASICLVNIFQQYDGVHRDSFVPT